LDSSLRAGPLAQLIVEKIKEGEDPNDLLSYNPIQWTNGSNIPFETGADWLKPLRELEINGRRDVFSQRYKLGN